MSESPSAAADKRAPADQSAPAGRTSGFLMKIVALLFLVAVILAECLIAYLYLPSNAEATGIDAVAAPAEIAKGEHGKAENGKAEHGKAENGKAEHGETKPAKGDHATKGEAKSSTEEEGDEESPEQVEIDLEQFSVTAHQPTSSTTMRIEFHLFGTIAAKDQEEFDRLMKTNQHRFREQVLVTVRSAEGVDLADAGLGLIKRQILEKTNALLGKPLLRAIVVSDFSYMEQ